MEAKGAYGLRVCKVYRVFRVYRVSYKNSRVLRMGLEGLQALGSRVGTYGFRVWVFQGFTLRDLLASGA